MSRYTVGRSYEYKAKKLLEQEGWQTVRAAGSKGDHDLVAFRKDGKVRCIQVKYTKTEAGMKRLLKMFTPQVTDAYVFELWVHFRGKWYMKVSDGIWVWCKGIYAYAFTEEGAKC